MYIPEFVCGIFATLGAEVAIIIIAAIIITAKGRKKKNDKSA